MDPSLAAALGIYGIGGGPTGAGPPATPFGGITGATAAPPQAMFPSFGFLSPKSTPQTPAPDPNTLGATYAPTLNAQAENPQWPSGGATGNPMADPRTQVALSGGAGATPGSNKLLDALRGVKAPAAPEVQSVRTPPPPQIAPIKGGEFLGLLTSLGVTPQEFVRMTQSRLGR
jgi:hypothetical protein